MSEFKDRLRQSRKAAGLSQAELAARAGITTRTVQNYEMGQRRPQHVEVVQKLADALGTQVEYLLGSADRLILEAQLRGGSGAAKDISALVSEVSGIFAGGHLDDEALDGAMRALNEAYWIAKEKNRKYAPGKKSADSKDKAAKDS